MSVIAVIKDALNGLVCMASDSQATSGDGSKLVLALPKIVRCGPCLFGCTSLAITQFVREYYAIGPWGDAVSLASFAAKWADHCRSHLNERGQLEKHNDMLLFPGEALIAKGGEFCKVDAAGQVITFALGFWAIGSGGAEARGAIWSMCGSADPHSIEHIARSGVLAAIDLDDGCSRPVIALWTDQ